MVWLHDSHTAGGLLQAGTSQFVWAGVLQARHHPQLQPLGQHHQAIAMQLALQNALPLYFTAHAEVALQLHPKHAVHVHLHTTATEYLTVPVVYRQGQQQHASQPERTYTCPRFQTNTLQVQQTITNDWLTMQLPDPGC